MPAAPSGSASPAPSTLPRFVGPVKAVVSTLGFALVWHEHGDVFLHRRDLVDEAAWPLQPGQRVAYRLLAGLKGMRAQQAEVQPQAAAALEPRQPAAAAPPAPAAPATPAAAATAAATAAAAQPPRTRPATRRVLPLFR